MTPGERGSRISRGAEIFASCPECGSPANITVDILRERLAMLNALSGALRSGERELETALDETREELAMLIQACLEEAWPYKMFSEHSDDVPRRLKGA